MPRQYHAYLSAPLPHTIVIFFWIWVQVLFFFSIISIVSIIRGISRWWRQAVLSCGLRFAVECLYELCPGFSMPDETVETRHPWLDFSLPRRPCLGISVLYSIILQTLNSCAIRPPYSTACLHHRLTPLTLRYNVLVLTCGSDGTALSACTWEAQNLQRFPLTSSPYEASPTYSSPFVIWPPGCVQAHLPPASVSYPAYSEA